MDSTAVDLNEIKNLAKKLALLNAISHNGKSRSKPVLGKLLGERPDLRPIVREIASIVEEVVQEVNSLSRSEQINMLSSLWPEALAEAETKARGEKVKERILPPLPNVEKYGCVVTRFAPNPDCVLHLGSARAIILCYEYAKMYRGKFILRFEDTDPRLKKSSLEFMELIRRDLEWLGCPPDEEYIQSDRLEIYYNYAEKLLSEGYAYVCTCRSDEFHARIMAGEPCPCRDLPPEEHLRRWDAMLGGIYGEGEAVVRIKTELKHPNPAIRDWPALRIIDVSRHPHPRVGSKYRVWPLYNFACGIDDHLMGITHIIRGKEHLTNQERQKYLYRYLGWEYPEAIHYGRLKIAGASLSKSKIIRGVMEGLYSGWDDPRLATFLALRRRGIRPEAIRKLILEIGPRPADITISWENLYAYNRKMIDPIANRFFFVWDPISLVVDGVTRDFVVKMPLHPDYPERGERILHVRAVNGVARILISSSDIERLGAGKIIRLMELFNVEIKAVSKAHVSAAFHSESFSEAKKFGAPLIHWLPEGEGIPCRVVMPDNSTINGLVESSIKISRVNDVVQFERLGFARIDGVGEGIIVYYAHK